MRRSEPSRGELLQFALNGSHTAAGESHDLPQIELLVGVPEEQPEHRAAVAAKECLGKEARSAIVSIIGSIVPFYGAIVKCPADLLPGSLSSLLPFSPAPFPRVLFGGRGFAILTRIPSSSFP